MDEPAGVDGAAGGDDSLARHLLAEHALPLLVRAAATEDVDLDGFEVEQIDQAGEGFAHPAVTLWSGVCLVWTFLRAFCGGRRRPPTRSRAVTGTTTGG